MVTWLTEALNPGFSNVGYQSYSNESVTGEHIERSTSAHDLLRAIKGEHQYEPIPMENEAPPEYESDNSDDEVFNNNRQ